MHQGPTIRSSFSGIGGVGFLYPTKTSMSITLILMLTDNIMVVYALRPTHFCKLNTSTAHSQHANLRKNLDILIWTH